MLQFPFQLPPQVLDLCGFFPFPSGPASLECGKVSPRFLSETTGTIRLILEELSNLGICGREQKSHRDKSTAIFFDGGIK